MSEAPASPALVTGHYAPANPVPSSGHYAPASVTYDTDVSSAASSQLSGFKAAVLRQGGATPSMLFDPIAVVAQRDLEFGRYVARRTANAVSE